MNGNCFSTVRKIMYKNLTLDELIKKKEEINNKKEILYDEISVLKSDIIEIDKEICHYYQKKFMESGEKVTEVYFKHYDKYLCKISKLIRIDNDGIIFNALCISEDAIIENYELQRSWEELFQDRITKKEFDDAFNNAIDNVKKLKSTSETSDCCFVDDEIWQSSSTNFYHLKGNIDGEQ